MNGKSGSSSRFHPSQKYTRLPSHDEDATETEMPLLQMEENCASDKPLVLNLNQHKINQPPMLKQVINPMFTEHIVPKTNTNNNNNTKTPVCDAKARTNNRHSFVNILTRTFRSLISQSDAPTRRKCQKMARTQRRRSSFRLEDIQIDLGDNNEREVELKMKIPRRCFTDSDLEKIAG